MRIEEHIGRQIRVLREQADLTLDQLAQAVGPHIGRKLTPQAVWQAENGKRDFKAAHLCAFALALNVPLSVLLAPPAGGEELELGEGGRNVGGPQAQQLFAPSGAVPEQWNALYDLLVGAEMLTRDLMAQRKELRKSEDKANRLHSLALALITAREAP